MRLDDHIDYSQCSLEELYDVARHINRRQFPERYAQIIEEIEIKRREQPVWRDTLEIPLYQWLFQTPDEVRTSDSIVRWWEQRRVPYNAFVSFLLRVLPALFSLQSGCSYQSMVFQPDVFTLVIFLVDCPPF
jgi:hypothetical protein